MEKIVLSLLVIFALICVGIFVCAILSSYFDAMKDLEDSEQEENQSRKRYIDSMVRSHYEDILESLALNGDIDFNAWMDVTRLNDEEFEKWIDNYFGFNKDYRLVTLNAKDDFLGMNGQQVKVIHSFNDWVTIEYLQDGVLCKSDLHRDELIWNDNLHLNK